MIKEINHICIVVSNLNKAIKFYEQLELKFLKITQLPADYCKKIYANKIKKVTYVKMVSEVQDKPPYPPSLELYEFEPKQTLNTNFGHICLLVDDINKIYKRLKKNIKFYSKPTKDKNKTSKVCFCRDLDNNLIELMERLWKKWLE